MPNETITKTLAVAAGVCIVCSVIVSSAAVGLKNRIEINKTLDKKRNVLLAAGLLQPEEKVDAAEVEKRFQEGITIRVFDFEQNKFRTDIVGEEIDERKVAKDPATSQEIPATEDIAGIKRRPNYVAVYTTADKNGNLDRVILPVYGKGLWSTMYGFLALDRDLRTVKNFGFYEHGETPGLGGEITQKWWKDQWNDKEAIDEKGNPQIVVVKGGVSKDENVALHEIDGISGATLTSRGVMYLVNYWLGEEGFGPMLKELQKEKAKKEAGRE